MLKALFDKIKNASEKTQEPSVSVELATAALLVEMERADFNNAPAERQVIETLLRQKFSLDDSTLAQLLTDADQQADSAVSLHEFTRWLNEHFEPAAKRQMVYMMWQVAYADGELDPEEEWLVRKVAELLHVPHEDFIKTKLSALASD